MAYQITLRDREQFVADGFIIVRDLLPHDLVESVRRGVLEIAGINPNDPSTWSKAAGAMWNCTAPTKAVRLNTEPIAEQLIGPNFMHGGVWHVGKESVGLPAWEEGFIPVLRAPVTGERRFQPLDDWHIDGAPDITVLPTVTALTSFCYLTDTPDYAGATAVVPTSHRAVYEYGVRHGFGPASAIATTPMQVAELRLPPPVPATGNAGDVIFFHYLMIHGGSVNYSDHIRVGLQTGYAIAPESPWQAKTGAPGQGWSPLDVTLRTDNIA